jgi:hypothetical protein
VDGGDGGPAHAGHDADAGQFGAMVDAGSDAGSFGAPGDGGYDATISDGGAGAPLEGGADASGDAGQKAASPFVVLPSLNGRQIMAIGVDDDNVYWAGEEPLAGGNTAVMSVPKNGGTPTIVYNSNDDTAGGYGPYGSFALDSTSAYFEYYTCCGPTYNPVLRIAKNGSDSEGGAPTLLVNGGANGYNMIPAFTIDTANLYFVQGGGISGVSLDGGTPTALFSTTGPGPVDPIIGEPIGFPGIDFLATDGQNVYFESGYTSGPSHLAYTGWLLSVPVGGGTPVILLSGESGEAGTGGLSPGYDYISVKNGLVFYSDGFSIYSVSVDGGSPTTVTTSANALNGAISDGTNVYSGTQGGVLTAPVTGGARVLLVDNDQTATGEGLIAIDDASVYFVAGAEIIKVAK